MKIAAVITADIVNSTLLPVPAVRKLIKGIQAIFLHQKIEFYRGDSFQVYCEDPHTAYVLTLMARTAARSLSDKADIRSGIGIGEVKLPVRFLNTSNSEVFILSGRAFDTLKDEAQRLDIKISNPQYHQAFEILSNYTDFVFQHMTPSQAVVIFHLLFNKTQKDIAKKLKKAQPTIAKHAKAGGWPELQRLSRQFENLIAEIL